MAVGDRVLRRPGEPIDLFAAVPRIGENNPSNFDEQIRRRFGTVQELGAQQNEFVNRQAQQALQARQAAMQRALQTPQNYMPQMQAGGKGQWLSPVKGKPWFGFGQEYKNGGYHQGLDWAIPSGTQILAPAGGKVLEYGFQEDGFGNHLRVQFDNGTYGILGHLASAALKAGDVFTAGQLLALSGNSGKSTGDHLHFETRKDLYEPKSAFDPSYLFGW